MAAILEAILKIAHIKALSWARDTAPRIFFEAEKYIFKKMLGGTCHKFDTFFSFSSWSNIHVLLTCTYTFILLVIVVFRKTYTVVEGIEQGLLRQNLALIKVLKQIKRRVWCVFISTVYCLRHKKVNLRNKKRKSGQKVEIEN